MTVHDAVGALPSLGRLRHVCRSIAVAEAVLNPGDSRYYSFDAHWSETEEIFSMRNGSGDEFDIVFSPASAYIRGLVPAAFHAQIEEPAFMFDGLPAVTFCLWRETRDAKWHAGRIDLPHGHMDPDGSDWMLRLLMSPTPEAFVSFAEDYYEQAVDLDAVRHVFEGQPLTPETVTSLNPDASFAEISREARLMGYPIAPIGGPS